MLDTGFLLKCCATASTLNSFRPIILWKIYTIVMLISLSIFIPFFIYFPINILLPNLGMHAVRTHFKLIEILPNVLTFCTWMKNAVQNVKSLKRKKTMIKDIQKDLENLKSPFLQLLKDNPFGTSPLSTRSPASSPHSPTPPLKILSHPVSRQINHFSIKI